MNRILLSALVDPKATTETHIRAAHHLLELCAIRMSPSKVTALAKAYQRRVENDNFTFLKFLSNAIHMTEAQAKAFREIELLMMPTNYAGRDHRKRTAQHTSGASA